MWPDHATENLNKSAQAYKNLPRPTNSKFVNSDSNLIKSSLIREGTIWDVWSFERKTYTWSLRKSSYFEIRRISWNPVDFRWNLADFMKSGRFQVKSTHNLIKSDVSTKTIQFDECRRGAMTLDFTGEIRRISKDQLPGMVSPMFTDVLSFKNIMNISNVLFWIQRSEGDTYLIKFSKATLVKLSTYNY